MTDLAKDIDRCMETVEVLRETLSGFDLSLDFMELTLNECKEQLAIPTTNGDGPSSTACDDQYRRAR